MTLLRRSSTLESHDQPKLHPEGSSSRTPVPKIIPKVAHSGTSLPRPLHLASRSQPLSSRSRIKYLESAGSFSIGAEKGPRATHKHTHTDAQEYTNTSTEMRRRGVRGSFGAAGGGSMDPATVASAAVTLPPTGRSGERGWGGSPGGAVNGRYNRFALTHFPRAYNGPPRCDVSLSLFLRSELPLLSCGTVFLFHVRLTNNRRWAIFWGGDVTCCNVAL